MDILACCGLFTLGKVFVRELYDNTTKATKRAGRSRVPLDNLKLPRREVNFEQPTAALTDCVTLSRHS